MLQPALPYDAFDTLSDRLAAALAASKKKKPFALRGTRTTEMVAAMREFHTSRLPENILANFIRLRSRVYAINQRVSEIYRAEEAAADDVRPALRRRRKTLLKSSVAVRKQALALFETLEATACSAHRAVPIALTLHPELEDAPANSARRQP